MYTAEDYDWFETLAKQGYLNKSEYEDLVLFNYNDKCGFEKMWNPYTKAARGIIFKKTTKELVALPFPKFFNVGEIQETLLTNLPNEPYEVFDKMDGSLGITYEDHHDDTRIATRGSFSSLQSQIATQIFQEKYAAKFDKMNLPITLLFEIIYPENRMSAGARLVLDYGTTKDTFLLAAFNIKTGVELQRNSVETIAKSLGCPIAKKYNYTIQQMIQLQKTLP